MVSSMTRKMISLAISLLVVVISLTGAALAATAPTVSTLTRYKPGFSGAPGKIAQDAAGNLYVADFWGKGIMKLGRNGSKLAFIPTNGRPSAVAVMPDSRLVVAIQAPEVFVAFYSQAGLELSRFTGQAKPFFRPSGIAIDAANYIYVVDAGDLTSDPDINVGCVRVYNSAGVHQLTFGTRTESNGNPSSSPTGDAQYKQPLGIAYERIANQIIVADTMNSRLQFYSAYSAGVCTFQKTIGTRASKGAGPSVGVAVRLTDPQGIGLEYTAGNVFNRIYLSEKALDEIVIVDAAGTCNGTTKICDNKELKRINASFGATGGVKFPAGVLFEKTATGGVLYAANASSSTTEANVIALSIDSGAVPTSATTININPLATNVYSAALTVSGSVLPSATPVSCSLNGGTFSSATVNGTGWTQDITGLVANQINYVTCKTSDASDKSFTYYASSTTAAPALAITSPADNSLTKISSALLTGTSNSSGVSISSSIAGSTCAPTDANFNWTCTVPLAEGSNTITIYASKTGTATASQQLVVVKDATAPGVVVSALIDGGVTNSAVQNIDGIVTDDHFSTVEVNDDLVPATARVTTGTATYFSVPVTLVRGSNLITVKATDSLGNYTIKTRTVTLNPEISGLTVELPADNSYLASAAPFTANGAVASGFGTVSSKYNTLDNDLGTWTTNGTYAVSGGTWSAAFTPVTGFKEYQFVSTDGSNTLSVKRTIDTNASNDILTITAPAADMATNSSSVSLDGYVAPSSPDLTVSIDGGSTVTVSPNQSTGAFNATVNLGAEGTHTVMVTTGSGKKAVRNIIYDNTKPVLGIQSDSRSMPTKISGSIEGSARISAITASLLDVPVSIPLTVFTFGSYNASTDSVIWHADLTPYTYDKISFTTTDPAGNSNTRQRTSATPKGDVDRDGYVRLSDALAALRHTAGTQVLTGDSFTEGDVGSLVDGRSSSDGNVNVIDAVLILQKAYGLINF